MGKAPHGSAGSLGGICAGQSYLERLGILYMEQIRLTIVTELYMREMGVRQFYETVGGRSYASVRRHFLKLVEYGWLRRVRTAVIGPGRPEVLYRSTELPVIDTETWRGIPFSIRDAFTVQLLEEMGGRLGAALSRGAAGGRSDEVATFKRIEVDELGWRQAHCAVERCFQTLLHEQTDAKIRLEESSEQPRLMVVNLAAFEALGSTSEGTDPLPKAAAIASPPPWPQRIGKVFASRIDLEIVDQLNRAPMSPEQLCAAIGGESDTQAVLRKCKRLTDLGWAVNIDTATGGPLYGANVTLFRAAAPNVSETDIFDMVPADARKGQIWDAFAPFVATSISAIEAGCFNNRFDRHLTMSPLLVDKIGWRQVTKTLRIFEDTLLRVDVDLAERRRRQEFRGFPAAFFVSSFPSPLEEIR